MLGGAGAAVLDRLPLPLAAVRPFMFLENAVENARGGWGRLRDAAEEPRYAAVRRGVEAYARDGSVLDLGCSQAVLREVLNAVRVRVPAAELDALAAVPGVRSVQVSRLVTASNARAGRYTGVDASAGALARARVADLPGTELVRADVTTFVPGSAPDVVVLNEVLYYLPRPLDVAERYARLLAPGGVLVVCCYARTWPTRRLLVRLARRLELVSTERVVTGRHAWDVAVLSAPGAP